MIKYGEKESDPSHMSVRQENIQLGGTNVPLCEIMAAWQYSSRITVIPPFPIPLVPAWTLLWTGTVYRRDLPPTPAHRPATRPPPLPTPAPACRRWLPHPCAPALRTPFPPQPPPPSRPHPPAPPPPPFVAGRACAHAPHPAPSPRPTASTPALYHTAMGIQTTCLRTRTRTRLGAALCYYRAPRTTHCAPPRTGTARILEGLPI